MGIQCDFRITMAVHQRAPLPCISVALDELYRLRHGRNNTMCSVVSRHLTMLASAKRGASESAKKAI